MTVFLIPPPLGQPRSVFAGVQVHAGYFRLSIIHRNLTWSTGALTCVHGLSYAYLYIDIYIFIYIYAHTRGGGGGGGWAHRQRVSTTFLTEKN